MRVPSRIAAGLCLALLLAACQRGGEGGAAADAPAPPAAQNVAQVEGITWFDGDIDAAFASAAAQGKLVFLYWGAEWCPPCHDLKAHVFPRQDFQQSLKQFVAVYLDGDAPGAQRIADEFRVQGYPSVVVLQADRTELARISGGSDLASYAEVLDLALEQAQPLDELLASLQRDAARRLDATECRRLAWNDWSAEDEEAAALSRALQLAATRCPAAVRVERDRLLVVAAGLAALAEGTAIGQGKAPSAHFAGLMSAMAQLLADAGRSLEVGSALLYLDEEFFLAARRSAAVAVAPLRANYFALLDAFENDARQSDTARLLSAARRLQVEKALDAEGKVSDAVAKRARATLDAYLARDYGKDARAGIVNSASWIFHELGDDQGLRALLEEQMQRSRTAYYYMPDMADIEERAGNVEAALGWLDRGYRESRGPATRFQWGAMYVHGLLRMAPQDASRIRAAVTEVIGELDGPDRIHARARVRLGRLNEALREWASGTGNEPALSAIASGWREICSRLPESDPTREACPALIG